MPRKDTRTKAERQTDREWATVKLHSILDPFPPEHREIVAVRTNRTRGRESWEFFAVDKGQFDVPSIVKVSLLVARILDWPMDTVYGGVANCDPHQALYHVSEALYGKPGAIATVKI